MSHTIAIPGSATLNSLVQLVTPASQHGMIWVGLGLMPRDQPLQGLVRPTTGTGLAPSWTGWAQLNADQGIEGIAKSDFTTMEALGKRVAEVAVRVNGARLAAAA